MEQLELVNKMLKEKNSEKVHMPLAKTCYYQAVIFGYFICALVASC